MVEPLHTTVGKISSIVYVFSAIVLATSFVSYMVWPIAAVAYVHVAATLLCSFASIGLVIWWLCEYQKA